MKTLKALTLLVSLLLLGGGIAHAVDIAGPIGAPLVITDDSKLVGNVTCSVTGAPCILFGAPSIKLELNGFTMTGTVLTAPPFFSPDLGCGGQFFGVGPDGVSDGIDTGGFSHVEIRGPGKVLYFRNHGIDVSGGTDVKVREVTSGRNCHNGIQLSASDSEVRENVVWNNSSVSTVPCGGIEIAGSDNRIRRNEAIGNGVFFSTVFGVVDFGIAVASGTGNSIEENNASGNFPNGIVLFPGTSGNYVGRNIALANPTMQDSGLVFPFPGGVDIREMGGPNVFQDNLCQTAAGTAACPNTPQFAGHQNPSN